MNHPIRTTITWAVVGFIVWYILTDPAGAADRVESGVGGLGSLADRVKEFVEGL